MNMNILNELDPKVAQVFISRGFTAKDFYCRECGKCLFDEEELKTYTICYQRTTDPNKQPKPIFLDKNHERIEHEPDQLQWLLYGKYLSATGKTCYRHICWDCFFKLLPTVEDIERRARKSKWYKAIANGNKVLPVKNIASSNYFSLLFDLTADEIAAEKVKLATASLEKFILKYGEEEGTKRFEKYRKRQAYTCSKEYMKETRGWSEDDWNNFNASRASTEENFIKRYGEELGKKKWKAYCAYEAYAGCTLIYFIDKYGKDEGTQKYTEVCDKKGFKFKQYSEISQVMFKELDNYLGDFALQSRWETKNFEYEFFIDWDGTKRIAKVDYYLNGKIIEFYGDFWHANPAIYAAEDRVAKKGTVASTAKEIWDNDAHRQKQIEALGYKVKIVWEKDYLDDPDSVIESCASFLKA